ncbi:MAG: hypothetical protein F9B45_22640 [Phycisphaera sp. RhM]|nr:hypothetical protein [Phycisphaera sp. RhM]
MIRTAPIFLTLILAAAPQTADAQNDESMRSQAVKSQAVKSQALASQSLETQLKAMDPQLLVKRVERRGDARRGALVFYKSAAACSKCHSDDPDRSPLGPALATNRTDVTDEFIIESILYPSRKIKAGYETLAVLTTDGDVLTGLRVPHDGPGIVLRDATDLHRNLVLAADDIASIKKQDVSLMPDGLVAALREEREFYDLVRYVAEVARGGPQRASELKPSADQLTVKDDTQNLDHAGILSRLGPQDLRVGERIYLNHCVNCHGADGNQPTLATARAFGSETLKYGSDPLSMLVTLTRGNGLMAAMQHLSPKERYQVIHFIRERFMRSGNPDYVALDQAYLDQLPEGSESGEFLIDGDRDFGPVLASQLGASINHALTFRLPHRVTVNYDLHRFRLGGVWRDGFLDLSETQHYRQRGEQMPRPVGTPLPGLGTYAWELGGSFELSATDKPPRGPVRSELASYKGHYLHGDQAILSYAIGGRDVLETLTSKRVGEIAVVEHTFHIAAGDRPLRLCVGKSSAGGGVGFDVAGHLVPSSSAPSGSLIAFPVAMEKPLESRANDNRAMHVVPSEKAKSLDLGTPGRTIAIRFRARGGGTLIASSPATGKWVPDGKTLFIRGNRLVFDIGWVGAITGQSMVADSRWHHAALVVGEQDTKLYVDGNLEASRAAFRRGPVDGHVLKLGATATNFGGDLDGEIAWAAVYDRVLSEDQIKSLGRHPDDEGTLWSWAAGDEASSVKTDDEPQQQSKSAVAAVSGQTDGFRWELDNRRMVLAIPPSDAARVFRLSRAGIDSDQVNSVRDFVAASANQAVLDPVELTAGGPTRWPQRLTFSGALGESINGYALDTIPIPFENPWNAWLRTSAVDFMSDGRAVVTTHGGDVYLVDGIDETLQKVTWKRFAAGLFEPFGVRVIADTIYVTCRDGIKRLHDYDANDEADFVEAFWIDDDVSSMFHAYNFDLQTDSEGNFYFAKAGQYTQHRRPGTIMKIPPEGGTADVVAWGLRTPNGMGKLADDRFTVSDNQGPWMPAGKISLVKPNGFFGNMPINTQQDQWLRGRHGGELPDTFDEPLIWMPQELDNSCGGQVWAGDERWGPLAGRLIHSSFGKGWLYYLSLQEIDGQTQASIISLPHQWDAGVMRLRVNPKDGQMYGTGLSGWQGPNGGKDGCLQRLRFTGRQARIIDRVRVVPNGIELTFNFEVSAEAGDPDSWDAQMWNYLWSKKYGSDQFSILRPGEKGRDTLTIDAIELSDDKRTVTLVTPDLTTCDQVHVEMGFADADGTLFREQVYLTVHAVPSI